MTLEEDLAAGLPPLQVDVQIRDLASDLAGSEIVSRNMTTNVLTSRLTGGMRPDHVWLHRDSGKAFPFEPSANMRWRGNLELELHPLAGVTESPLGDAGGIYAQAAELEDVQPTSLLGYAVECSKEELVHHTTLIRRYDNGDTRLDHLTPGLPRMCSLGDLIFLDPLVGTFYSHREGGPPRLLTGFIAMRGHTTIGESDHVVINLASGARVLSRRVLLSAEADRAAEEFHSSSLDAPGAGDDQEVPTAYFSGAFSVRIQNNWDPNRVASQLIWDGIPDLELEISLGFQRCLHGACRERRAHDAGACGMHKGDIDGIDWDRRLRFLDIARPMLPPQLRDWAELEALLLGYFIGRLGPADELWQLHLHLLKCYRVACTNVRVPGRLQCSIHAREFFDRGLLHSMASNSIRLLQEHSFATGEAAARLAENEVQRLRVILPMLAPTVREEEEYQDLPNAFNLIYQGAMRRPMPKLQKPERRRRLDI